MSSCTLHRWLSAFVVLAGLALSSSRMYGQTPTPIPEPRQAATNQSSADQPFADQPTADQLGDALLSHHRFQEAIAAFQSVPRRSSGVWAKMGIAYQMMYNVQQATRCYKASIKLDSSDAAVLNDLGTVYDSMKDYKAAERMYRKALKVDPQSALIHKNLGTALMAEQKFQKGWESYQAALAIDPQIFERRSQLRTGNQATVQERGAMNYYMAKGCVRAGQNERAIDYLRRALNEGFVNSRKIVDDSEFAGLRGVPAFQQLLGDRNAP